MQYKQQEYLIIQLLLNGAYISILSREVYTEFIDESNLPKKRDNIGYCLYLTSGT